MQSTEEILEGVIERLKEELKAKNSLIDRLQRTSHEFEEFVTDFGHKIIDETKTKKIYQLPKLRSFRITRNNQKPSGRDKRTARE